MVDFLGGRLALSMLAGCLVSYWPLARERSLAGSLG